MMKYHVAVVLAAGYSTRYGSDKRLSGKTHPLAAQTIAKVCEQYSQVIVVHRHNENLNFLDSLQHLNIDFVPAPKQAIGLATSIASAAKYILASDEYKDTSILSLFLADMPYLQNSTIDALLTVATVDKIIRPSYRDQHGHPVLFGKQYFEQLTTLIGDQGAKEILTNNKANVVSVNVDDNGCITDIDRPKDWL